MIDSATIREFNSEFVCSRAELFQNTIVNVDNSADNNLVSIEDRIFSGLAWLKDSKNRAEETKLEAFSGDSVDDITS